MWKSPTYERTKPKQLVCNRCHATGRIQCEICAGKGQVIIGRDTRGYPKYGQCGACYSTKMMRCRTCGGTGYN